jgi:ribose transport system permease protein
MNQTKMASQKPLWWIWERFGIYIILVIFAVALSISTEYFLTVRNLSNVMQQVATLALISAGMLTTIVAGKVDLTVGAFSGLAGALFAGWSLQFGAVPAIIMGFAVAVLWGLTNGFLITRGKNLDVIVTLAMLMIAEGISLLDTNGRPIIGFPAAISFLGNASVLGVPVLIMVAVVALLIMHVVLRYTAFGRELYAIGGNFEAARLSGVPSTRRIISAFIISAVLSALAGLVTIGRVASAQPAEGVGNEFTAVGAVLIGGASLTGGMGTVPGTAAGVVILGLISNGSNLLQVSPYFQYVVRGVVILFAIMLDQLGRKSR